MPASILDYASPRSDRSVGLRFLGLPPPGRVIVEILIVTQLAIWFTGFKEPDKLMLAYELVWLPATALILIRPLYRRVLPPQRNDAVDQRWWRMAAWISIIMVALSVRFDKCPHATYLAVGPYQWVTSGERCGNQRNYRNICLYVLDG